MNEKIASWNSIKDIPDNAVPNKQDIKVELPPEPLKTDPIFLYIGKNLHNPDTVLHGN